MRLTDRIRLAMGLHWAGSKPQAEEIGITLPGVLAVVCLVLAYGLVDQIEQRAEKHLAAEKALADLHQQQTAMLACLNGGNSGLYTVEDGFRHYIICDTYTISDEGVTHRKPNL